MVRTSFAFLGLQEGKDCRTRYASGKIRSSLSNCLTLFQGRLGEKLVIFPLTFHCDPLLRRHRKPNKRIIPAFRLRLEATSRLQCENTPNDLGAVFEITRRCDTPMNSLILVFPTEFAFPNCHYERNKVHDNNNQETATTTTTGCPAL